MPRCLSEGVDIFLKSVERQGESGHDVRVSQAMHSIHKCVAKDAPHLLAVLCNEPRYS